MTFQDFNPARWLSDLRADRARRRTALVEPFVNPLAGPRVREDTALWDVPQRLSAQYKDYFTGPHYVAQQERADWQQTDRGIQEFAARFVLEMRKRMIPVYVHCAFRTPEEQAKVAAKGNSKLSTVIAPHVQGKAVDIVHSGFHWELSPDEWRFFGLVGKEVARKMGLNVTWGGDWKFYDPAHWEVTGWKADVRHVVNVGEPIRKTPHRIKAEGFNYQAGYTGARKGS